MNSRLPIGTIVNVVLVIVGSLIGVQIGGLFSPGIKQIVFQAIGLCSLLIGAQMSGKLPEGYMLVLILSMILGGILGEIIHLDQQLDHLGTYLKETFRSDNEQFTEGFITAFLIFCIGSMVIVGALEEGINGNRELLLIKSLLDGVTSIALASTYGIGVLFSIFPMLMIQGGLTVIAKSVESFFSATIIALISAAGGLLIIGIGIRLLELGQINLENLLPSLLFVVIIGWIKDLYFNK